MFGLHSVYFNSLPKKMYNVERTVSSTIYTHPSVSTLDLSASLLSNPPSLSTPGLFCSKSRYIISLQIFTMLYHKETHLQSFIKACCCCCEVASVMSDSVRPHRWPPTRLLCPQDSPGKITRVGCHFLLLIKAMAHKLESFTGKKYLHFCVLLKT